MARLIFYTPSGKKVDYFLKEFNTIGRHPNQDIQILDRIVSKEHAELFKHTDGKYYLQDIGSRNGTILNSKKIDEKPVQLSTDDEITLGAYVLKFIDDNEEKPKIAYDTSKPKNDISTAIQHKINVQNPQFLPESTITDQNILRRDYEKLRIAMELSNEASFVFELDKLLDIIVEKIFQVFTADRVIILLPTDDGNLEQYLARDRRGRNIQNVRISQTLLNEVCTGRNGVLSSDAMFDQRFSSSDSIILDNIRSTMCVPLMYADELLGIINIDTQFITSAFTEKDLQIMVGFARQAAFNIKHSKMMQNIEQSIIARDNLKRIISPHLIDDVLNGKLQLQKAGGKSYATVFFSDIRGFTSMTERSDPQDIVTTLNDYFEAMVDIIFSYEGTLDKFVGDEIMAVWGVSVAKNDHPIRAVQCAIDSIQTLNAFNEKRAKLNLEPISIGIGIATGDMIAGYMGSTQAMSYTVIGDTVNLASRLCSAAGPGEVLIDEHCYQHVKSHIKCLKLPPILVKGKNAPIQIYRAESIIE